VAGDIGELQGASESPWLGGLPRRDVVLIPALASLTLLVLVVLLVACEIVAERYVMPTILGNICVSVDEVNGIGAGIPHCMREGQAPGAPRVLYSFNECGRRNPTASCAPAAPGTQRIALLGASFAEGYPVAIADSFAAKLEPILSGQCGAHVEIQNLAALGTDLSGDYRRLPEALALKPALIVVAVLPTDLAGLELYRHVLHRHDPLERPRAGPIDEGWLRRLEHLAQRAAEAGPGALRLVKLYRHYTYRDTDLYVRMFLRNTDSADYLRPPFSAAWEQRLAATEIVLADMSAKARAAGVPLALLFTPSRAQAAILARPGRFGAVDASALPRRLREISARHDILFLDTAPVMAAHDRPELLYFDIDGHPNESGNTVIARSIAQTLVAGRNSPFAACAPRSAHGE
jgi:hypothetical protein